MFKPIKKFFHNYKQYHNLDKKYGFDTSVDITGNDIYIDITSKSIRIHLLGNELPEVVKELVVTSSMYHHIPSQVRFKASDINMKTSIQTMWDFHISRIKLSLRKGE